MNQLFTTNDIEQPETSGSSVWTLSKLLQGFVEVAPINDRPVVALVLDSKKAVPGSLFCALKGTHRHGLDFAAQAVERGSVAILTESDANVTLASCEAMAERFQVPVLMLAHLGRHLSAIAGRFYDNPGTDLDLIGVTGTNGKTSVCHMLAQSLYAHNCCGVVGTLGYGLPDDLTSTEYTTPDAVRLQAILAELRQRQIKIVAMEISSHALHQWRAAGLPITTAIFTNLTRDHLDYHQHLGAYAQAKRQLFQMVGLKHAVLNADDPLSLEILGELSVNVEPVLYSVDPRFTPSHSVATARWLRLEFLEHQDRGMRLWINGSWGRGDVTVPMLGLFNAANLLAVLATLLLRDINLGTALLYLSKVRGVPGRMECFGNASQPLVVVDYAHTPDALEQALKELRAHHPVRLITVFGCGGERDRGKRPQMGAVAERMSDVVILTDDNPRSEDGGHIIQEILAGIKVPKTVQVERQRAQAIAQAVKFATPKDIVLIAGKGHETTQRIGNQEYPFSDRVEVAKILRESLTSP